MAKTNENQDDEKVDLAEGEGDSASAGQDDEGAEEGAEDTEETTDEGAEGEDAEEGAEDEDAGEEGADDEGADDEAGDDGKFVMPDKFKGKKPEEIAKSYLELEKLIDKKATEKARGMNTGRKIVKPAAGATTDIETRIAKAFEGKDIKKLAPVDFAKIIGKVIAEGVEERAQAIARSTYENADTTKAQVQKDIDAAVKTYPQLKENEGYRNMVVALIENASGQGKIMTLKEACAEVNKALGIKPGTKAADAGKDGKGKDGKKKPLRTDVEHAAGSEGGDKETDADKVLSGILGAGGKGTSNKLGGLGI